MDSVISFLIRQNLKIRTKFKFFLILLNKVSRLLIRCKICGIIWTFVIRNWKLYVRSLFRYMRGQFARYPPDIVKQIAKYRWYMNKCENFTVPKKILKFAQDVCMKNAECAATNYAGWDSEITFSLKQFLTRIQIIFGNCRIVPKTLRSLLCPQSDKVFRF